VTTAPKVSVCVVTYNHEPYIRDCLQGLLAQKTDFEFEVIVGDDCSTDGTSKIVDELAGEDARLRVLRPKRNIGVTQNLLAVHNAARGAYIAHLDGDDLADPGKLVAQVKILDANSDLALCGHRMRVVDEHGQPTGGVYPAKLSASFGIGKLIRCGLPVLASSIMYRSEARTLRSLDYELFDWLLYTDIMKRGDGGFIPEVLGSYRVNPSSLTASLAVSGMVARMLELYERRFQELPQYRADFFTWALFAVYTAVAYKAPVTAAHRRFLAKTFTPTALPALIDAALWNIENGKTMAR
jgi:glycosyltransferase involved in cell wall biosynthesis